MTRCYYHAEIACFIRESDSRILGELAQRHGFDLNDAQRNAWLQQIALLKVWLAEVDGTIAFEYVIPRIGKRIDCIVLRTGLIFAIEFKVVATEFDVQGLELDWTCIAWDADFHFDGTRWLFKSFSGTRWQDIRNPDAQQYLKNAYRVLLTRARQGCVIFLPEGDPFDETRPPEFYDHTYHYLLSVGIPELTLS